MATEKVAVPQTGFLKEDDLTKTLGFQKSALWDGNFFGGRFVSAFRHSGELLNFSLKKWSEIYSKTELFKRQVKKVPRMTKTTHKLAPEKVAVPQSTFMKSQGLCQIALFQKTRLWGGNFLWPNPTLKQNFLKKFSFAECFRPL